MNLRLYFKRFVSLPELGNENIKYLISIEWQKIYIFISSLWCPDKRAALSCTTQHVGKWGTERLNTTFPLPTVRCVGYSVKLI